MWTVPPMRGAIVLAFTLALLPACSGKPTTSTRDVGRVREPVAATIVRTTTSSFEFKGVSKGLFIPYTKEDHAFDLEVETPALRLPLRGGCKRQVRHGLGTGAHRLPLPG